MTTEQISADTSTNPPPVRQQHSGWGTLGIIVITIAGTASQILIRNNIFHGLSSTSARPSDAAAASGSTSTH